MKSYAIIFFAFAIIPFVSLLSLPTFAEDSIKIGWIGPLTGNSAVLGIDSVPAVQLAIDEVNQNGGIGGKKVELLIEDDRHEVTDSVSAYRRLAANGAVAVLISTYGGYMATAAVRTESDPVLINPLDCNERIASLPGSTFCVATLTESISDSLREHMSEQGHFPALVIYDHHHPFMEIVTNSLKKDIAAKDLTVEGIDQNSFTNYRSLFTRHKSRGLKSIVFLGHDPMGKAMQEARQLGVDAAFYTVGTITSPGFQKLAGNAANGTFVAYWEAPRSSEFDTFLRQFSAKVGRPPILELASVPSYDAARILLAALRSATTASNVITPAALGRELLTTRDFRGLSGVITIDSDGIVRSIREQMYLFQDGKLSPIPVEK